MHVFINPGHGGADPGAIGYSGSFEKNINAKIGDVVAVELKKAGYKVTNYQQRRTLSDVAAKANASNADLFVSIHCNSVANREARGTETWHYTGCPHGKKAAQAIQSEIIGVIGTKDRGLKTSKSLYVLKKTIMPAVLVEVGFISNKDEEQLIINNVDKIGRAIAFGIKKASK